MKPTVQLLLALALAGLTRPAAAARTADLRPLALPAAAPALDVDTPWLDSLDLALARSAVDYKPILLFATSDDCSHCEHMKRTTFRDPAVRRLLRQYVLLEVNVSRNRPLAGRLGIEGTPTCIVLASDGRALGRLTGYVAPEDLVDALQQVLSGDRAAGAAQERLASLLKWLDEGASAATNRWAEVAELMGDAHTRADLRARTARFPESARSHLVALLAAPALAARLGALELLEEWTGGDQGFDPWLGAEANREALARWAGWAADTTAWARAAAPWDDAEVARRLQDVISGDRDRALRALRALESAGSRAAPAIAAFARAQRNLPPDAAGRLRELRYAVALPTRSDFDPAVVAHRLVFGNLDGKLQALRQLATAGSAALPILREFTGESSALVRAAAVESLLRLGGRPVIPEVEQLIRAERDPEVIIRAVKGLGALRSRTALAVMTSLVKHPEEDVVIATLESMAKLRSHEPKEALAACLEDGRWRVRAAALKAVEELKLAALGDAVAARLKDEDAFVRYGAVKALTQTSREKAAELLEEVFLSDDELKGPVLEALAALSKAPTAKMIAALEKAPPGVIVGALDVLAAQQERKGPAVALRFVGHADLDVSCTALRAVAAQVGEQPKVQAALARSLREGRPEEQFAAMEALIGNLAAVKLVVTLRSVAPPVAPSTAAASGDDLFSAFEEAPAAAPAAVPEPAGGDLFAAFGGDEEGAAPAVAEAAGPRVAPDRALEDAIRKAGASTNLLLRRGGQTLLAALGDDAAAASVLEQWSELPEAARLQLAGVLEPGANAPRTRELLERLLDDGVPAVRQAAAGQAIKAAQVAGVADALFKRLADPARPLAPSVIVDWSLENNLKTQAARTAVRPWAERWLREPPRPPLQVLAVVLLQYLWRTSDEQLLEPLTRNKNEFVRRAAYRALLVKSLARADALFPRAAADPAARVRLVVGAAFQNDTWTHEFDEADSAYSYHSFSSSRRLPSAAAREALERLAGDPDVRVAMASQLALLQAGQLKDPAGLVRPLQALPDRSLAFNQVLSALRSSGKPAPALAPLLPLLEESELDDDDKKFVRDLLAPAGAAGAVTASNLLAVAGVASNEPPAGPLRAVFFVEHGCEACARVRLLLEQVKAAFPELDVAELEIVRVEVRDLNRELCDRFHAPARVEGLTPALFAAAGFLAGEGELAADRLVDLFVRSTGRRFDYVLNQPGLETNVVAVTESAINTPPVALEDAALLAERPGSSTPSRWPLVAAGVAGALAVLIVVGLRRRLSPRGQR